VRGKEKMENYKERYQTSYQRSSSITKTNQTCDECFYCEVSKCNEFYCHYSHGGLFKEDGIRVFSNYFCNSFRKMNY